MPKPYPKEFRDDVVRVALNRYGVDVDTGAFSPQCCCGKNTTVYSLEAQRRALGRS